MIERYLRVTMRSPEESGKGRSTLVVTHYDPDSSGRKVMVTGLDSFGHSRGREFRFKDRAQAMAAIGEIAVAPELRKDVDVSTATVAWAFAERTKYRVSVTDEKGRTAWMMPSPRKARSMGGGSEVDVWWTWDANEAATFTGIEAVSAAMGRMMDCPTGDHIASSHGGYGQIDISGAAVAALPEDAKPAAQAA